jgi:hypothetical protein
VRAIQVASKVFAKEIKDSSILLLGDSQAALNALRKISSPSPVINQQLKLLFRICSSGAFDIIPRWIPREQLTEADELSRRPDASDWGITEEQVRRILNHFGVSVELDIFASDIPHVVEPFISAFYVPGCIAMQALIQDWKLYLPHPSATIWAFPPTKAVSATLS